MTIRAVAKKELRQLKRDPRTVSILVLVPAGLLILFGFVLSFDVKHVSLDVVDQDRSQSSRAFVKALTSSEYFDQVSESASTKIAGAKLDEGSATLTLLLPTGFAADLAAGSTSTIQAVVDGSNATAAQTAIAYLSAYTRSYTMTTQTRGYEQNAALLSSRQTVLYNPQLKSELFLIPGLVAFILMVSCTVATSLSVVRERETGTMEQMLVSPLTPVQVLVGKSIPYAIISIFATVLVLTTGVLVFGVQIRGSLWWLSLASFLFVVGAQGLGLLISTVTSSQQVAFMVATLITLLPTFLLSGFAFPIRSMPVAVQIVTYIVPARYFITILRGVILRGTGPSSYWLELVALGVFAILTMGVARARLKKVRL